MLIVYRYWSKIEDFDDDDDDDDDGSDSVIYPHV